MRKLSRIGNERIVYKMVSNVSQLALLANGLADKSRGTIRRRFKKVKFALPRKKNFIWKKSKRSLKGFQANSFHFSLEALVLKIKIDCEMSDSTDFDGKQNVLDVKELHQSS